jgi:hypothetical protein
MLSHCDIGNGNPLHNQAQLATAVGYIYTVAQSPDSAFSRRKFLQAAADTPTHSTAAAAQALAGMKGAGALAPAVGGRLAPDLQATLVPSPVDNCSAQHGGTTQHSRQLQSQGHTTYALKGISARMPFFVTQTVKARHAHMHDALLLPLLATCKCASRLCLSPLFRTHLHRSRPAFKALKGPSAGHVSADAQLFCAARKWDKPPCKYYWQATAAAAGRTRGKHKQLQRCRSSALPQY